MMYTLKMLVIEAIVLIAIWAFSLAVVTAELPIQSSVWAIFWTCLFASLPSVITAAGALIVSLRNSSKAVVAANKMDQVIEKVDEQHKATNSRLDQLVKVTGEAARAEGVTAGEEAQRGRQRESDGLKQ